MNKQQFLDLGLTEDQAAKAETESKKELETYVPKHRFDEVNKENKWKLIQEILMILKKS